MIDVMRKRGETNQVLVGMVAYYDAAKTSIYWGCIVSCRVF